MAGTIVQDDRLTQTTSTLPFLDLPPELRIAVYEQFLDETVGRAPKCTFYPDALFQSDSASHLYSQEERTMRLHGLLLANRRISQEYLRTYYHRAQALVMIDRADDLTDVWESTTLRMEWRSCELWIYIPDVLASRLACQDWKIIQNFLEKEFLVRVKRLLLSMPRLVSASIRWITDTRSTTAKMLYDTCVTDPEQTLASDFIELLIGLPSIQSIEIHIQETARKLQKRGAGWVTVESGLHR